MFTVQIVLCRGDSRGKTEGCIESGKMIRQKSSWQQGLGILSELGEKEKGEQERVGEGEMGKGNGRDKRGEERKEGGGGTEHQRIRDVHTMGQTYL